MNEAINAEITLESLGMTKSAASSPATPISDPSNHYSPGKTSSVEEKAVSLLGSGISAESVASALGVTPGRIAQLLSQQYFSDKVAALRYQNLQANNKRDDSYNSLEDKLIAKLEKSLPLMVRPDQILKGIQIINATKRRGQSAPDTTTSSQNIVNLVLPTIIANKIVTNAQNQVTKAGEQELLTMPSGNLLKQVEAAQTAQTAQSERLEHVHTERSTANS